MYFLKVYVCEQSLGLLLRLIYLNTYCKKKKKKKKKEQTKS